jgi:tetratricopeptide (TPR) repeat protein
MATQRLNLTFDVLAALLLAVCFTLLTDFTHRMLNSDPDAIGIFSVSVQAALTVAATSTFTRAGWSWLGGALKHFRRSLRNRALWRFGLSLALTVLVVLAWSLLPERFARGYNRRGLAERENNPAAALRDYQRAIALNPLMYQPYLNLGGLMEDFYRYDEAAKQYRQAITVGYTDPTAYDNLARVLLLSGDSNTALRILDAAMRLKPSAEVKSALQKNRAWAELNLGFYTQAIADATQSNSAAGECVLGKVYNKLGKTKEAEQIWVSFEQRARAMVGSRPTIEPDCWLLAENSNENK